MQNRFLIKDWGNPFYLREETNLLSWEVEMGRATVFSHSRASWICECHPMFSGEIVEAPERLPEAPKKLPTFDEAIEEIQNWRNVPAPTIDNQNRRMSIPNPPFEISEIYRRFLEEPERVEHREPSWMNAVRQMCFRAFEGCVVRCTIDSNIFTYCIRLEYRNRRVEYRITNEITMDRDALQQITMNMITEMSRGLARGG